MSDMLLEVNEEMRQQRLRDFWARYGQWLIGFVLCCILVTAATAFWEYRLNKRLQASMEQALLATANDAEKPSAPAALDPIIADAPALLQTPLLIQKAQKLEQANDLAAAQKIYLQIVQNKKADPTWTALATLHAVRVGFLTKAKPSDLLTLIEPLTKEDAPFRASALEYKGLALQASGKIAEANAIFAELSSDSTAPQSLRERANSLIKTLPANEAK